MGRFPPLPSCLLNITLVRSACTLGGFFSLGSSRTKMTATVRTGGVSFSAALGPPTTHQPNCRHIPSRTTSLRFCADANSSKDMKALPKSTWHPCQWAGAAAKSTQETGLTACVVENPDDSMWGEKRRKRSKCVKHPTHLQLQHLGPHPHWQ